MRFRSTLLIVTALAFVTTQRLDAGGWGGIEGRILWDGPLPKDDVKTVPATHQDYDFCVKGPYGAEKPGEVIVVDPDSRGVANIFIYVKDRRPDIHPDLPQDEDEVRDWDEKEFSDANGHSYDEAIRMATGDREKIDRLTGPATIDQVFCRYVPRALALRQGMRLLVKNSEPVTHNVKVSGFDNNFNPNMPANTALTLSLVAESIPIQVQCSIHGWMQMSVMVFDHPYYAVTGADGAFRIEDAPAGELSLAIRNSNGKYIERALEIEVPEDDTIDLGTIRWSGD